MSFGLMALVWESYGALQSSLKAWDSILHHYHTRVCAEYVKYRGSPQVNSNFLYLNHGSRRRAYCMSSFRVRSCRIHLMHLKL